MGKKIVLSLIFCFIGYGLFGRTIRVATYNLDNYGIVDRWTGGEFLRNYPKPELEKGAIRRVIGEVKPDILVLQEIGGPSFLKELQDDLRSEGVNYPYSAIMNGADSVRQLAVLSKEPIKEVMRFSELTYPGFKNEKTAVRRGLMEVCFKSEEIEWSLFGVHLKSRLSNKDPEDDKSAKQRMGEATVIVQKILERHPDGQKDYYLIVGDFNDYPNSKVVKSFLKFRRKEISVMLSGIDSRGETWTHNREGYGVYSQIDYLLISPALYKKTEAKGATIFDAPFALKGSDHRMLYVDLNFDSKKYDNNQLRSNGERNG
ncbi:MAG: hypothetical protein C5B43_01510 [Verrucomicrobia bacterium]|nr:MAG: hypothetical protein C5B43_01510 [Verrucomicrobiota bacterium]